MDRGRTLLCALATVFALIGSGCGGMVQTYEGPKRAAQELATIKTNVGQLTFDTVWVDAVDNMNLVRAYSELEVSPGLHTLRVQLSSGFLKTNKTIAFEARAGRVYRVNGIIGASRTIAWIEDENTHEFIAGERP